MYVCVLHSSSSFSSFCSSSSYRRNLLREDRCLSDHGECRYLGKGESRMTWMFQKVRRKRWCMDVALRQPRVGSSSILFAVAYRRRHPSLSAATFHSWRSTTTAASADKIRFTRIQILCRPCDGSLVHIKNKTAACPTRERERETETERASQRKGKDMRQSQWWYCSSFRRGIIKKRKKLHQESDEAHHPLPMYTYLYLFLNSTMEKLSQQRRRMFFVLLSTKEEGKRGKQNGAERLIFLWWSSRHLWSINSVSPSVHSSCFLSSFPKMVADANLFALVVVNLISCSVPFPYSSMIELVLSTR